MWISKKVYCGLFLHWDFPFLSSSYLPCGLLEVEWPTSLHVSHNYLAGFKKTKSYLLAQNSDIGQASALVWKL